ncbi:MULTISPECIES: TauD/TfdA family dioxygenase [Rhodococcus]|jgi:taurine dioxygenase|uniref:Alpha-ketoglutarate-dependent taurine dioxygenase n=2 Tax=Rhodococcus jostii TaxID=132919 RepID=Q0SDV4_RHOJR|nr:MULTISPECIES: TauD/TfdA family dioxygenase [Rhodococcus]ABG94282.1 alpha-ketoglutarate-dependent taurine dioxygenase [Rhodococcus jostii RHA1]EJI99466.1 alpha-ketoglutarate-dependent taurine dioxygenase [Rhodococcus sp. JVH1]MDH6287531.1 taurine dioxygenase [Rhodococcus opacus]MDI9976520.1 TauD/TfdA family dioxygenase [Rhodococcus sp. IEGM 1307]MDV6280940.1 TauD/TfdA family dioxygenase [Rhodococcus jostii]
MSTAFETRTPSLTLDKFGPHFGAEIIGLDVASATDDEVAAIRSALTEHKVLVLRGQSLGDASHIEFGRRLGRLTAGHPVHDSGDVAQEVYALDSQDNGFADVWHTDVTFMKRPPLGSILRPVVLPPHGGDTNWADSQLAYESLSLPVRQMIDQLTAVHDGNREFGYYLAQKRGGKGNVWDGEEVTALVPVEHPVVRVHPETGRKGIFVNPGFTSHIAGVSEAESRGILDFLYAHLTKPEHIVRHRWRLGDLVLWDNRSTAHYANRDYGTQHRVMHRITLEGDVPVGPQ